MCGLEEEGHGGEGKGEGAMCFELGFKKTGIVFSGGWQAAVERGVFLVGCVFRETVRKALSVKENRLRFLVSI